jgi:hypothetical protein
MDAVSVLKNDVFRSLATVFVPALFASTPLLLVLANFFAVNPITAIQDETLPIAILVFVVALIASFILENLGVYMSISSSINGYCSGTTPSCRTYRTHTCVWR